MVLTGCTKTEEKSGNYYVLPDLNGYTLDEIEDLFEARNQEFDIVFESVEDEELEYIKENWADLRFKIEDLGGAL